MILCEGFSDVGFLGRLIGDRNIPPFCIQHTGESRYNPGGKDKFVRKLGALKLNRSFRANVRGVLLVADSDDDATEAFDNVRQQVISAGFAAPNGEGMTAAGQPDICIVTLPRGAPGNLETFLLEAAKIPNPQINGHAEEFVQNVAHGAAWSATGRDELLLRSIMAAAWSRDPMINLGQLFRDNQASRCIPVETQPFNDLANLIHQFANAH